MPILNQNSPQEVNEYLQFTKNYPNAHFYQDYRWSKVKNNLKCEVVYLKKDNKITAGCVFYIRPIAAGYSIIYGQRGPLCDLNDPQVLLDLIQEAKPLVKKYKAFMFKFDPNVQDGEELVKMYQKHNFKIKGKGYSKLELVLSRRSMVLNIDGKSLDELLVGFKRGTRYCVKRSLKNGLTVEQGFSKENLDIFMDILEETCIRDGIEHRPRAFFEAIADNFTNDEARLYLIRDDEDYLAGAVGINYGGRMMYYHSGSRGIKRTKLPNYLIQYELIKWACDSGCKVYDMGGIIHEDMDDGLYKFKIGFCIGNPMDEYIGEMDYPLNSVLYHGFNFAYKMLQKIRRRRVLKQLRQQQEQEGEKDEKNID